MISLCAAALGTIFAWPLWSPQARLFFNKE
jgi:hypothetical protein